MAEELKKTTSKPRKPRSSNNVIGGQTEPIILNNATKLDIDVNKTLIDNIIEAGLNSQLNTQELDKFTTISNSRDQIYQLIDTMAQDSAVSSIIRTYAEDICEPADNGHIVWAESTDPKISKFVNYLLNIMNVDKNIFSWTYSLIKYGDVYLRLYRESDYEDPLFKTDNIDKMLSARNVLNEKLNESLNTINESVNLAIHNTNNRYSFYVEAISDPGTMFELTRFGKTYGYIETPNMPTAMNNSESNPLLSAEQLVATYQMKSNDVKIYQADDFVHAYLEDSYSRYPECVELFNNANENTNNNAYSYKVRRGKSLLQDSYKIWREKSLLEASVLLNRITRSSILRKVQVEVGDMPKEQAQATLRRVKEMMEQKTALNVNSSMSEYSNPGPIENNIYFATHDGKGAITVESIGGDINVRDIADLDWWNNKFYSSYGIPKQYFGWTDDGAGFNGGTSLTILSSVYAKGVKRIKNALLQMLTDAINLFLLDRGCNSYLNNFVLKMKSPVTQEEIDYRTDLTNKISALSNMQSLFSDVEDKSRRLVILKTLISTLNYGDEILAVIQEEIEATDEAKIKAEEEAANEAALTDTEESNSINTSTSEEPEEELDLPPMPENLDTESFNKTILTEDAEFEEDVDKIIDEVVIEEDILPTPEKLNASIDFTENL